MNRIEITGRLVSDVELKQTPSGVSVSSFSVAVNRPRVKDTTDFIDVVAWRQTAEYVSKYGHKGDRIAVSGILTSRKYEKNGEKRTAWEITADECELMTDKPSNSSQEAQKPSFGNVYIPECYKTPTSENLADVEGLPF